VSIRYIGLGPIGLVCDTCGLVWTDGRSAKVLRDNAKFAGWCERRRYRAVRDYCPGCARAIGEREEMRRKGRK
jgi:hypothetical protein